MPARVRFITDPACAWSWAAEPTVRKLMLEFGETLRFTWVMGGLARDYTQDYAGAAAGGAGVLPGAFGEWLEVAEAERMPLDPRLWTEGPIASTYPACMAVVAAAQQGEGGAHSATRETNPAYRYLRALREGLLCFRRKLDTTEALVEEARAAGLDVERFRRDLGSHGTVEAFGADLDEARAVPEEARAAGAVTQLAGGLERVTFPAVAFVGENGERHWIFGRAPYEDWARAAEAAGGRREGAAALEPLAALRRFGRMTTREVEAVCDLPGPLARAELWRLAAEWRVRPVRVLTGWLWEAA